MVEFNKDSNELNIKTSVHPANAKLIGVDDSKDLKIFIEKSNLFGIEEYLRSDMNNELGGVLVGNVYKDNEGRIFIDIKNNIIAESTTASLSRLTFTHETWQIINDNLEKSFPEQKILGWYHSHPGHSVFLSTYDVFIQDNFFNLPYMTAFVYDPVINDRGFFYKDDSGIKKCSGYFIYSDKEDIQKELTMSSDVKLEMPKPLEPVEFRNIEKKSPETKDESKMKNVVIIALLLINFILCVLMFLKMNNYDKELLRFENVNNQLNELRSENEKLSKKVEELTIGLESTANSDLSIKYTVKEGETLRSIVIAVLKDESKIDNVVKMNSLKNEFDIKPGQIIELPY